MGAGSAPQLPSANFVANQEGPGEGYIIGPLDELQIFVWRNPELGGKVQVRPDGRITTPLVSDMPALRDYERAMSVAVNAEYARMGSAVNDGDEIAFRPPVSGG